jgi:hypothetical protein
VEAVVASVTVSEPVAQLLSAAASTAAPQAARTRAARPPDPLIVPARRPSALRFAQQRGRDRGRDKLAP